MFLSPKPKARLGQVARSVWTPVTKVSDILPNANKSLLNK